MKANMAGRDTTRSSEGAVRAGRDFQCHLIL